MVEENFCRPTFLSSVLCSNDFQTNKKSKELDAENTKLATALLPPHHFKMLHISTIFGSCAAKLVKNKMIYRPVNLLWRPNLSDPAANVGGRGKKNPLMLFMFAAGTSVAAEWCKENLRWAAAAAAPALDFRGPGPTLAAAAGPGGARLLEGPGPANYQPAQILQFQMSTQS